MILNSPYISGSLTVTGNIISSGSITISGSIASASYASNAERVDGLDSTSFVFTSSYNTDSASVSTRVTKIEGNYATTGSNIFTGAQTVCANITSTGTIIAQTLNVQQVTSSIVYSSGSNIFGCSTSDVQQMTGSVRITGSLNTIGNACMTSICSPAHVGGTFSGTTIYGSTAICGGVVCGTNATFNGDVLITNSSNAQIGFNTTGALNSVGAYLYFNRSGVNKWTAGMGPLDGSDDYQLVTAGYKALNIKATTGIATFACRVCAPSLTVSNTNAVLTIQGTATPGEAQVDLEGKNSGGTVRSATFKYDNSDIIRLGTSSNITMRFETNDTTRLCIMNTGIAVFACQVCAPLLRVQTAGGEAEAIRHSNATVNNWSIGTDASCNAFFQTFEAAKCLILSTGGSGAARLTINGSGNVGIGTTSPSVKLHVYAANEIFRLETTAATGSNYFLFRSPSADMGYIGYGASGNNNITLINYLNADMTFGTNSTERMRITSAGIACFACQICTASSVYSTTYYLPATAASLQTTDAGAYVSLFGATGGGGITNTVILGTNNTERMRIRPITTLTGAGGSGTGGATTVIGSCSMAGLLLVSIATQNVSAIFFINSNNAVNLISQSTTETRFSTTSANANTANVYISGTDLILQNNIQATRDFYVQYFGKT